MKIVDYKQMSVVMTIQTANCNTYQVMLCVFVNTRFVPGHLILSVCIFVIPVKVYSDIYIQNIVLICKRMPFLVQVRFRDVESRRKPLLAGATLV